MHSHLSAQLPPNGSGYDSDRDLPSTDSVGGELLRESPFVMKKALYQRWLLFLHFPHEPIPYVVVLAQVGCNAH